MPAVRVFTPPPLGIAELCSLKAAQRVSVCLPARNEAATVGVICSAIVRRLMGKHALVDELLVFDDGSVDDTARIARESGATVITVDEVLAELPVGTGKGNVLWKSVAASTGDLIVWCDADLTSFHPSWVTRLVSPLLLDSTIDYVKGFYVRREDANGQGGGRTTELAARPLLSRFFPPLATVRQPLGGESAARRSLLETLPFVEGYGVEVGLLIDTLRIAGIEAIAQVDLGRRTHRHRPLLDLSAQAAEILAVVLKRAGLDTGEQHPLVRADGKVFDVTVRERPALVTVAGYR